jgi:hypothetical protein
MDTGVVFVKVNAQTAVYHACKAQACVLSVNMATGVKNAKIIVVVPVQFAK